MKNNPLSQYQGPPSASQAAEGINIAAANAKRLAEDARLLLDAGRYPTATSLAMLAIEESGKTSILRHMSLAASESELRECWRRYRKHTEKNHFALVLDRVRRGRASKLSDFKNLFTQGTEFARRTYDTVKQLGFYSDCCGKAHWSAPTEVIDEALAIPLVQFAMALTKKNDQVTTQEMELWAANMKTGMTEENLLRWCAAMVAEGLKPAGYAEEMWRFL